MAFWDESIVVIGDVHLADTPPGRRADGYREQILEKLDEALSHPSDIVVWIGDLFHAKAANKVPYSITNEFATRMRDGRLHYIVPGNHDLADGTIESIKRQPIGMLMHVPNVRLLMGGATTPGGAKLYGIPGTGPVCDATDWAMNEWVDLDRAREADIIFAHAPISMEEKPWPTWHPDALPLAPPTILVYGHQHDQARVFTTPAGLTVVATGAISRGSISEADTIPSYVTFQDGMICVEPITCALPKEQIYRWDEITGVKLKDERMSSFIDQLSATKLEGFSLEGLLKDLDERTDVPEHVRSAAKGILSK